MKNSDRGRRPYVRPIQRVEVSEGNVKVRMILIVVLLSLAVVAIATGLMSSLRTEPGWNVIESQAKQINCSQDFSLNYDFSDSGSAANAQFKELTALYSTACEDAFFIFSSDVPSEKSDNVYELNARPNEIVTVDPALYDALTLMKSYLRRNIYLAPVYAEYNRIFMAGNEVEAADADPAQNPELVEDIARLAAFANDPAMVDVQLLGDNQVYLFVADEYLTFVKDNEIEKLIDFGWMKNAFIIDYLAQVLIENGFTNGYLSSFDGFTRNLDTRGNTYSINVFDRQGSDIYGAAVLNYTAPQAIVSLRDYPMSGLDQWNYYGFSNGRIATMMIDPRDGMDKASVDSLLCYGANQSCADILLHVAPVFICDEFDARILRADADIGIYSIWCEDQTIFYTEEQPKLTVNPQENFSYTKVFAGK